MLILGSQVLVGFQFRAILEPGFEKLPRVSQYLTLGAISLMLLAVGLLVAPGAYHRIVAEGEDTEDLHRFSTGVMDLALLPFALSLGIDFFIATEKVRGHVSGIIVGGAVAGAALFCWYGLETLHKAGRARRIRELQTMAQDKGQPAPAGTELKDKIRHVLTEARVVLPGAQALLGFQFITILTEGFERLPDSSKYLHLASLVLITLSVIFLMTPAAYHRIVEQGEETEHFHRFASRMVLAAMVPLALGICGDFFVVARKVTGSRALSAGAALLMLAFFYGLWFGLTSYRRSRKSPDKSQVVSHRSQQATD